MTTAVRECVCGAWLPDDHDADELCGRCEYAAGLEDAADARMEWEREGA